MQSQHVVEERHGFAAVLFVAPRRKLHTVKEGTARILYSSHAPLWRYRVNIGKFGEMSGMMVIIGLVWVVMLFAIAQGDVEIFPTLHEGLDLNLFVLFSLVVLLVSAGVLFMAHFAILSWRNRAGHSARDKRRINRQHLKAVHILPKGNRPWHHPLFHAARKRVR